MLLTGCKPLPKSEGVRGAPLTIHYEAKCAGIIQEYVRHQNRREFISADRYQDMIERLDNCEHPGDPQWRAAYAHDSDTDMRDARPSSADDSSEEARHG